MSSPPLFHEIVDAADALREEDQEALIDILRRRMIERRRERLFEDVKAAQEEFAAGLCRKMSVEDIMKELEQDSFSPSLGTHDEVY